MQARSPLLKFRCHGPFPEESTQPAVSPLLPGNKHLPRQQEAARGFYSEPRFVSCESTPPSRKELTHAGSSQDGRLRRLPPTTQDASGR